MVSTTITVFFTNNAIPATGISPLPTIDIWQSETSTQIVTAASMIEIGDGFYRYSFSYDPSYTYSARADAGSTFNDSERYSWVEISSSASGTTIPGRIV
jgi:hypothetical protein